MLRISTSLSTLIAVSLTWACAGAPPRDAHSPPRPVSPSRPDAAPPVDDAAKAAEAERIPEPPPECRAFLERKAAPAAPCNDAPSAQRALAMALATTDSAERDAKLTALESCVVIPTGIVRALRAENAPTECGDVLVDPIVSQPPSGLSPELRDVLLGLGYAAQAARLVRTPPRLDPPWERSRVEQFVGGALRQWIEGQAKAIYSVSLRGSNLSGYAKGVVAVEAGLADLRFVSVAREAPIPDELARDPELKDAYLGALEQALEPRKQRGRDAALVGLKKLGEMGIINDPRVQRARRLLSELYAGRRIDALDSLLLPPLSPLSPKSSEEELAAQLPTFYAGIVLEKADPNRPALLRALLERGLDPKMQSRLLASKLTAESRRLVARAHVALGQRYWRSGDFVAASARVEGLPLKGPAADEAALVSALARALSAGPKDAAEMMLKGPHLPKGIGDVATLDELGKRKGQVGGMALFDAARLLEIARPADAGAEYWEGVAHRYESASKLLTDPAQKANALERASAARATVKAVGGI